MMKLTNKLRNSTSSNQITELTVTTSTVNGESKIVIKHTIIKSFPLNEKNMGIAQGLYSEITSDGYELGIKEVAKFQLKGILE